MSQIGYFNNNRLHIRDYNDAAHKDKVYCSDGHLLIPKRGEIKTHHFSHRQGEGQNCHIDSDGKSEWHLWWQNRLHRNRIEFQFRKEQLKIADSINTTTSVTANDTLHIIEFQNSVMAAAEIKFREQFYTRTDLLTQWGVSYCRSMLTWIFNLTSCDIEIEHVFGDFICFKWLKGTKYMLQASLNNVNTEVYYDVGKRELIHVVAIHKPDVQDTKLIGRVIPLRLIDQLCFKDIVIENNDPIEDIHRQRTLSIVDNYQTINYMPGDSYLATLIDELKKLYFNKKTINSKQKATVEEWLTKLKGASQ